MGNKSSSAGAGGGGGHHSRRRDTFGSSPVVGTKHGINTSSMDGGDTTDSRAYNSTSSNGGGGSGGGGSAAMFVDVSRTSRQLAAHSRLAGAPHGARSVVVIDLNSIRDHSPPAIPAPNTHEHSAAATAQPHDHKSDMIAAAVTSTLAAALLDLSKGPKLPQLASPQAIVITPATGTGGPPAAIPPTVAHETMIDPRHHLRPAAVTIAPAIADPRIDEHSPPASPDIGRLALERSDSGETTAAGHATSATAGGGATGEHKTPPPATRHDDSSSSASSASSAGSSTVSSMHGSSSSNNMIAVVNAPLPTLLATTNSAAGPANAAGGSGVVVSVISGSTLVRSNSRSQIRTHPNSLVIDPLTQPLVLRRSPSANPVTSRSLNESPDVTLLLVFSYLDLDTLHALVSTCKRFKQRLASEEASEVFFWGFVRAQNWQKAKYEWDRERTRKLLAQMRAPTKGDGPGGGWLTGGYGWVPQKETRSLPNRCCVDYDTGGSAGSGGGGARRFCSHYPLIPGSFDFYLDKMISLRLTSNLLGRKAVQARRMADQTASEELFKTRTSQVCGVILFGCILVFLLIQFWSSGSGGSASRSPSWLTFYAPIITAYPFVAALLRVQAVGGLCVLSCDAIRNSADPLLPAPRPRATRSCPVGRKTEYACAWMLGCGFWDVIGLLVYFSLWFIPLKLDGYLSVEDGWTWNRVFVPLWAGTLSAWSLVLYWIFYLRYAFTRDNRLQSDRQSFISQALRFLLAYGHTYEQIIAYKARRLRRDSAVFAMMLTYASGTALLWIARVTAEEHAAADAASGVVTTPAPLTISPWLLVAPTWIFLLCVSVFICLRGIFTDYSRHTPCVPLGFICCVVIPLFVTSVLFAAAYSSGSSDMDEDGSEGGGSVITKKMVLAPLWSPAVLFPCFAIFAHRKCQRVR